MIQIEINLQHEGIHSWPEADTIPEVSYLKHPHRHIFFIQMRKEVFHDNRDIEFINWKHQVEKYLNERWGFDLRSTSCEQFAKDLYETFNCSYVRVMEDNENGSIISK